MDLLEYQAKQLLAKHGVNLPQGSLWPDLPPGDDFVLKAQVPVGGRGRAGGILQASRSDVGERVRDLRKVTIKGHAVDAVYVETKVAHEAEWYVAVMVDRVSGEPRIVVSNAGGVDVESAAGDEFHSERIDPLIGPQTFNFRNTASKLTPEQRLWPALIDHLRRLYLLFLQEDALLVEINPLAVTSSGELVALDAKITLDDDALYRHGDRPLPDAQGKTDFEKEIGRLEGVGVELSGPVVAMSNGAGLTMATLDQLVFHGAGVGGLIELHGALTHGPERVADLLCASMLLNPAVLLVNAHYQLRPMPVLAQGILDALGRDGWTIPPERVVARVRGVREDEANAMLAARGCVVVRDFDRACATAAELASASLGSVEPGS